LQLGSKIRTYRCHTDEGRFSRKGSALHDMTSRVARLARVWGQHARALKRAYEPTELCALTEQTRALCVAAQGLGELARRAETFSAIAHQRLKKQAF
jgi:hypothetical protein